MLRSNTAHLYSEDKSAESPPKQRSRLCGQTAHSPITTKKGEKLSFLSFSTQSRGRTGTGVNLLVFETSASTDSAIWAGDSIAESRDKDIIFFINQQFCSKNLLKINHYYRKWRVEGFIPVIVFNL